MKNLNNRKFVELLRMMAGQDKDGYSEVLREAANRLEQLERELKHEEREDSKQEK